MLLYGGNERTQTVRTAGMPQNGSHAVQLCGLGRTAKLEKTVLSDKPP